jgi:hypothetical protein
LFHEFEALVREGVFPFQGKNFVPLKTFCLQLQQQDHPIQNVYCCFCRVSLFAQFIASTPEDADFPNIQILSPIAHLAAGH